MPGTVDMTHEQRMQLEQILEKIPPGDGSRPSLMAGVDSPPREDPKAAIMQHVMDTRAELLQRYVPRV